MTDPYVWFDPFVAKATADSLPQKISDARSSAYGAAMQEVNRLMAQPLRRGLEVAAEKLGRDLGGHENARRAVQLVCDGLMQNGKQEVSFMEKPEQMATMVIQSFDVRPFRVSAGISFGHYEMMEAARYGRY